MVAGTAEVTIVRCSLLFAMGRADAAVHVENDYLRRMRHEPCRSTPRSCRPRLQRSRRWPIAPSRSVPSGWWKRPVFRWPCRQQSSAWRDRVPDGRRRSHRHSRQGARKRTGETDPSCRAIRSCRYGYPGKHPRPSQSGRGHRQAPGRRATRHQR